MMLENFSKIRTLRNDYNKKVYATDIQTDKKGMEDFNFNLN